MKKSIGVVQMCLEMVIVSPFTVEKSRHCAMGLAAGWIC
jgi:hypothetical protein